MITATSVEEEIIGYLKMLDDKEKQAVLTVVEAFAAHHVADRWSDPEFVAEMERRDNEMEKGVDKGVTWEEVQAMTTKMVSER